MRHKVVGVMSLEVRCECCRLCRSLHRYQLQYKNMDLDKIIEDCNRGRINGFKNFQLDADLDVVQAAAIEWVNCKCW
jgi:hypothetical protein